MVMKRILPTSNWGDNTEFLARFIKRHGRFPKRNGGMLDELYKVATSSVLLDPLRQFCTDKEYAKIYIEGLIGRELIPETYSVLRSAAEVDAYTPRKYPCIFKPTASSNQVYICDTSERYLPKKSLKLWLQESYYMKSREKNFKYLQPKIIVEELLVPDDDIPLQDFKVLCIHGEPIFIQVDDDRWTNHTRSFYSVDWKRLEIDWEYPRSERIEIRPKSLEKMLEVSRVLAVPFGCGIVRVDFYITDSGLKVGELTFYPGAGKKPIKPVSADNMLGSMVRAKREDIPVLRDALREYC